MSGYLFLNGFKEKLINVVISPYFLAIPVALIIIYFLPPIKKYSIELVKKSLCDKPNCHVSLADINGDGYSEKLILFNNQRGDAAIKVVNLEGVLMHWWDFNGSIYRDVPKTDDYNHDGVPEIYFISNHLDSVYLNIVMLSKDQNPKIKQKFITLTSLNGRMSDYTINNWCFPDLQLDGFDEVIFNLHAGYSIQPRQLFAYDQKNDTVLSSPLMGSKVTFIPVQLNDDPYYEFIGQSSSAGNISPGMNIPYKDSSSWLMALDHKLNFMFDPVEFKGHKTTLQSQPVKINGTYSVLSLFEFSSVNPWKAALLLHDINGRLVKKVELEKPSGEEFYTLLFDNFTNQETVRIKDDDGFIYAISPSLSLKKIGRLPVNCPGNFENVDLDDDNMDELVSIGNDFETFYILRNDFSNIAEIKVPFERTRFYFSRQLNGNDKPLLFLQRGEREMLFRYGFNNLWYAKIPIWLGIYFLILGFIHIVRRFQNIQQKKLKAREDQLAELQLETVSTYLDPHFTFNTLNTITGLIYKEEKIKAHQIITRFTTLIRTTLMQSGKVGRSLSDELDFVKDYLDIQKLRFGNIFTWEIIVDENVDLTQIVPKMLVQVYAENAIKHGLKNKGSGGRLEIILHQAKETTITVRDNGVGREKAGMNAEPGTGKGLNIMQQIFDLFEKTNKIRITQTITDLKNENGGNAGTEVLLTIRNI